MKKTPSLYSGWFERSTTDLQGLHLLVSPPAEPPNTALVMAGGHMALNKEPDSVVATPLLVTPADEPPAIAAVQDRLTISQNEQTE